MTLAPGRDRSSLSFFSSALSSFSCAIRSAFLFFRISSNLTGSAAQQRRRQIHKKLVRTDAMMHWRCRGLPMATVAVAASGAKRRRRRRSGVEAVREGNLLPAQCGLNGPSWAESEILPCGAAGPAYDRSCLVMAKWAGPSGRASSANSLARPKHGMARLISCRASPIACVCRATS